MKVSATIEIPNRVLQVECEDMAQSDFDWAEFKRQLDACLNFMGIDGSVLRLSRRPNKT